MKTTKQYGPKADLALSVWVKLNRATTTFGKLAGKSISGFGLTGPQFAVIESLGHLGSMKISSLCSKMLVSGGNLTVVIDNLERDEYVERKPSKEDRRAINIQLTPKGQSYFNEIFPKHAKQITEFASVLTEEEQIRLSELLKKLGLELQKKYGKNLLTVQ